MLDVREAPDRPGREFVFITQRATCTHDDQPAVTDTDPIPLNEKEQIPV